MRKQEIVHLHALGVVLRGEVESSANPSDDAFAAYDAMDVGPTAIDRQKTTHRTATLELFDELGGVARRHAETSTPALTPP